MSKFPNLKANILRLQGKKWKRAPSLLCNSFTFFFLFILISLSLINSSFDRMSRQAFSAPWCSGPAVVLLSRVPQVRVGRTADLTVWQPVNNCSAVGIICVHQCQGKNEGVEDETNSTCSCSWREYLGRYVYIYIWLVAFSWAIKWRSGIVSIPVCRNIISRENKSQQ